MAKWGINCSQCGSTIIHSEVPDTLAEFLQPKTPEVLQQEKMKCPTCGETVSFGRRDLRYFSN